MCASFNIGKIRDQAINEIQIMESTTLTHPSDILDKVYGKSAVIQYHI